MEDGEGAPFIDPPWIVFGQNSDVAVQFSVAFGALARLSRDAIWREIHISMKGIDGGCGFLFHFLKIGKSMFQEVGFTDFFKPST